MVKGLQVVAGTAMAWFLPGLLLTAALFPRADELRPLARGVLSVGLSVALVLFVSLPLALAGRLQPTPLWAALLAVAALLAALAGRRGARGLWRAGLARRRRRRRAPFVPAAALLTGVAYLSNYVAQPPYHPRASAWRYVADALEIVAAQGMPAHSLQWDVPMPFVNNKILFYLFSASWLELAGLADAAAAATQLFVPLALGFGLLSAALFLTELVPGPFAALGLLLLFWTPHFSNKLAAYTGEGFAIALLFAVSWTAHRVLFEPDRRLLALSPVLLGLLTISHGVVGVVGILFVGALFLSRLLAWPIHWRLLGKGLYLFGVAGGLSLVALLSLGGGAITGSASVTKEARYQPYRGGDPTFALSQILGGRKRRALPIRYKSERALYVPARELATDLVSKSRVPLLPWARDEGWSAWAEALLVWGVAAALTLRGGATGRAYVVAFGLFLALLYAWGLAYSWAFETWLPATHPGRREFDYGLLASHLLLVMGLASLHASRARRGPALAVRVGLVVLGCCLYYQVIPLLAHNVSRSTLSPAGRDALVWLREHTEAEARVLTNVRSTGAFRVVAGRHSLTEGRTPYLDPGLLAHALGLLDEATAFFSSPHTSRFLERNGVDYVVLTGSRLEFGGHNYLPPQSRPALEGVDGLRERVSFGDVVIYAVDGREADAGPTPSRTWGQGQSGGPFRKPSDDSALIMGRRSRR